ncbi:MAG: hypothetical protein ACI9KE_006465 [Polyangiales bacterium]|jgi:hypothetical protein
MNGEHDLTTILRALSPALSDEEFVFLSIPGARYGDHASLAPVVSVAERDGLTLVVPKTRADDADLPYGGVFRQITLQVHSSLEACGLTATISTALADRGISANIVAGTRHDHLFVRSAQAQEAVKTLHRLSQATKRPKDLRSQR